MVWCVPDPANCTAVTRAPAPPEAVVFTGVPAQRAVVAWPDLTTSGWCWSTVGHQVTPLRVYVLVLWDLPCLPGTAEYSAPLVTWLVRLLCTIQAEVAVTSRRILAPVHTSHCSHRSPATIVGAVLVPRAARTVITVSLVPHLLQLFPRAPVQPLCITRYGDPQLTKHRTDHASRSQPRHYHSWRPSS
jgi:hypothetical protein